PWVADCVGYGLGCWLGNGAPAVVVAAAPAALWLVVWADCPDTFCLIVRQGASRMSSWSAPNVFAPFRASTPTTWRGTAFTRTVWPTGDWVPNSSRAMVVPIRHTPADPATSWEVNARPSSTGQSRTVRKSGVVP